MRNADGGSHLQFSKIKIIDASCSRNRPTFVAALPAVVIGFSLRRYPLAISKCTPYSYLLADTDSLRARIVRGVSY